ncbi:MULTISPECIES: hypothetical protein [Streptomyces]|uniref:hypothetical protein n=1 Tax=Streptomyces TaxID=1883 RepID=UPI000A805CDC|nr:MULTISPECIES: hypothetical protein [Streptomyces]MCF3119763.1 hypothetical protein [Streptomyces arenae]
MLTTETSTETPRDTEPAAPTTPAGAGRHRGPVAEHDEATAPKGRHRKQPDAS